MRPGVIAFDLDGTLADTMPTLASLALNCMRSHGAAGTPDADLTEWYWRTVGRSFGDQLELGWPRHPDNLATARLFAATKVEHWLRCPPVHDARRAVELALSSGRRVVVASSTEPHFVQRYLGQWRFPSGVEVRREGPKLAALVWCAAQAGGCVFVGDAPYDRNLAQVLGCGFVGVSRTFGPDGWPPPRPILERGPLEAALRVLHGGVAHAG